jgi:catechol 2,3-dioxygenase
MSDWPLGALDLKVLDLDREVEFYQKLGLTRLPDEADAAVFGAGARPILRLRPLRGGRPRPSRTAGLYHFAVLLPTEQELGGFLQRTLEERLPLTGTADHFVSQALYFDDPEGNGIEVYADRPRSEWRYPNGRIDIGTMHLDFERLLSIAEKPHPNFSDGTVLGHMHLNVADLDRSQSFYESLGMALMAEIGGMMRFMSWDGYHHHLGINLLQGRGAAPVANDVNGVAGFDVTRPATTAADPDGIEVRALTPVA